MIGEGGHYCSPFNCLLAVRKCNFKTYNSLNLNGGSKICKRIIALALGCSASLLGQGQNVTHHYQRYGVAEGLPSSEVYETLQDRKGYLWFATDAGVSRFNGYEFTNYTTNDGLTDNTVFHLYEDFKGRIWFLPYNSQLCYFENDSIYAYEHNHQLEAIIPANWIRSMAIDSAETIAFSGRRFGFGTLTKSGEFNYQTVMNKDTGMVTMHHHGGETLIYGLESVHGKRQDNINIFYGKNGVQTIVFSSVSTYDWAISKHSKFDQCLLFGVGGTLCWEEDGVFRTIAINDQVNGIYVDAFEQVWLAKYNDGVKVYASLNALFDGAPPLRYILTDKNVSNIYEDREGSIWLAVQNSGVYQIPNPHIEVHTLSNDELTNRVSGLYLDDDHQLYAGTFNGRVFKINRNNVEHLYTHPHGVTIYALQYFTNEQGERTLKRGKKLTATNGVVWKAFSKYLLAIDGTDTSRYFDRSNKEAPFNAVFEDANGTIWAGSNNGLHRYRNGKLEAITGDPKLGERVEDIDQLGDGTLLLATKSNGLLFWNNGLQRSMTELDGLTSNIIRDIYVDHEEDIWVATSNGLNRVIKQGDTYTVQNIKHMHGLPTNEVNRVVAHGDTLWAATNKGVVWFHKRYVQRNIIPPTLHINRISINEEEVTLQQTYELPHDRNYLEIAFTALSYRNHKVPYRYRLLHIDDAWIVGYARTVRYPSLAPGNYTFEVQAANEDGVWSETQRMTFKIYPPFWKTWWFIVLMAFAFMMGVLWLFRLRELKRSKKEAQARWLEQQKMNAIKSELKALRAQMNPHFTFNTLSAIQTAVNNNNTAEASKYIVLFATLIRKVLENSKHSHIKLEEELDMLRLYIELEQLRFSNRFAYTITVSKQLDTDYLEIPSMVIQPFVENAIIHGLAPKAKGGQLTLAVELNNDRLICTVKDNGIGRKQARKIKADKGLNHHSMATEITEGRMDLYQQEIGKEFSVNITDLVNEEGNAVGTEVELIFPVL